MLNIGLIGSGFIGNVHANAYKNLKEAKLVAIADLNETAGRKIADEYGCKYYAQAEQMLQEEDIDVVDICIPTFLHEAYVKLAAKYHKHVLCEKPFGLSVESCTNMMKACEEAGVKLMVAQVGRWKPQFKMIKELYTNGTLGDIRMVSGKRLSQAPGWTNWHADPKKSGGGLYDLQVHNIDYFISVFGGVENVFANGWKTEAGCWDHVVCNIKFKNGISVVDEGSLCMTENYPFTIGIRFAGDKGTVEADYIGKKNIEKNGDEVNTLILYENGKEAQNLSFDSIDIYAAEIKDFIAAIENNTEVPIPVEESIYVMKIVEAIVKSLETGKVVNI